QETAVLCRVGTPCGSPATSVAGGRSEEDHSDTLRPDSNEDENQERCHAPANAEWFELACSSDRQGWLPSFLGLAVPASVHTAGFVRLDECVEPVVLRLFPLRAEPLLAFSVASCSSALPRDVL